MQACGLEFPDALHYFVPHQTWASPEDDGHVRIGITALGIRLAGDIYMCRPKRAGSLVKQGDSIAVVELAKSIVAVRSPVTGEVIEVNPLLEEQPELVHRQPYGDGWLVRMRLTDWEHDQQHLLHGQAVLPAMRHHAWLHRLEF